MIYIFFRGDYFYPIELPDDDTAIKNAEINPGTTKVQRFPDTTIWSLNPTLNTEAKPVGDGD